jgi:hypothetical protein
MSNFPYTQLLTFDQTGAFVSSVDTASNWPDWDNDDLYEVGDAGLTTGPYMGTTVINGVLSPVFQSGVNPLWVVVIYPGPFIDTATNPPTYGGLTVQSFSFCFLEGSRIAAPTGDCAVEELVIDDLIMTSEGRTVPVKWIGRQTVSPRFGPAERLMPVRFAAGSLGEGVPSADLTVTADHGMLVDGVICHAGALVNGTTITRVPLAEMGEGYVVYHIETEAHEIILANGAPAETFIDNVSRRVFDNYAEFEALYGDVPEMAELPYPRAMSARQVPERIRAKLAGAAAA